MAKLPHWAQEAQREDGDDFDDDERLRARAWMLKNAGRSRSPLVRNLMGELRQMELAASMLGFGNLWNYDGEDDLGA
jgi:hypothetical protein